MSNDLASQLHPDEAARLAELEEVVTDGLNTFVTVGRALAEIRDSRLYRTTHHTFEAYCQQQWGLSRPRAYELINAAAVTEAVSAMADTPTPTNERQARQLTGLPAETAAEVMRKAHDDSDGKVTASAIRQARETVAPKPRDVFADKIAAELAASDESYAEQAAADQPSPAVTDWLESSQAVKDSGYLREYTKAIHRAGEFLRFDATRLSSLLEPVDVEILERYVASVSRFADTIRRGRTGLRVINGGN